MRRSGATPEPSQAPSPGRDIVWALAIKVAALVALYVAFFGPSHRVTVSPDRIAAVLIDPARGSGGH